MSNILVKSLRICRICGLEANTEDDLALFDKRKDCKYGRRPLCKKCHNKRVVKKRKHNDRIYLKHKYNDLISRCYNPNYAHYPYYGARGITVCEEWRDNYALFIDWALDSGWCRNLEIDRIDNDGPYSPDNCRWVTHKKQNLNRRNRVTFQEKGTRICQICKTEKPLTEFYKDKNKLLGLMYRCKPCHRNRIKQNNTRKDENG